MFGQPFRLRGRILQPEPHGRSIETGDAARDDEQDFPPGQGDLRVVIEPGRAYCSAASALAAAFEEDTLPSPTSSSLRSGWGRDVVVLSAASLLGMGKGVSFSIVMDGLLWLPLRWN